LDNSARWFLAGILVSLVNTGLVIVFIGIPGVTDRERDPIEGAAAPAERTHIIVVDEHGKLLTERIELSSPGQAAAVASSASGAEQPSTAATAEATPTPLLGLGGPRFAALDQPTFVTAHNGTAWVATRRFALKRVNLEGGVSDESLRGINNLGGSVILDVDATSNGTLYALVYDGPLEWRVFRKPGGGGDWAQIATAGRVGWAAEVLALTAADDGSVYLSASDPAGLFRLEPNHTTVRDWVLGDRPLGLDVSGDDMRLLYVVPQSLDRPAEQVRQVYDSRLGPWFSTYESCAPPTTASPTPTGGGPTQAAALQPGSSVPLLPRDVAIAHDEGPVQDGALVVDGGNHVVWYQRHFGEGDALFGVPCEAGADERHLSGPRGVAIDEDGNVFIADTGNNRVVVLPKTAG
jgi:hypothetical protein